MRDRSPQFTDAEYLELGRKIQQALATAGATGSWPLMINLVDHKRTLVATNGEGKDVFEVRFSRILI